MLDKRSRVLPETKPVSIMEWVAAHHGDEREKEQADHKQDFEDGHVEFRDAKVSHSDSV